MKFVFICLLSVSVSASAVAFAAEYPSCQTLASFDFPHANRIPGKKIAMVSVQGLPAYAYEAECSSAIATARLIADGGCVEETLNTKSTESGVQTQKRLRCYSRSLQTLHVYIAERQGRQINGTITTGWEL